MFTNSFSSVFALGKSRDAHPKKKCILSPHRILLPVGALILLVGVALCGVMSTQVMPAMGGESQPVQREPIVDRLPADTPDQPAVATSDIVASNVQITLEQIDGKVLSGRLEGIDDDGVTLELADGLHTFALPLVRRVDRIERKPVAPSPLTLTWIDGSTMDGNDFIWGGQSAVLITHEGSIELPIDRVLSIAWKFPVKTNANASSPSIDEIGDDTDRDRIAEKPVATPKLAWLESIPEATLSDLVVIGNGDTFEFVECAITAISDKTVTVVLEEETISVKRAKVIGLRWLRAGGAGAPPSGGQTVIEGGGGSVRGDRVRWSPAGLIVDAMRMPASMLDSIDYAAGRMTSLAKMPTERLEVDPYFGALGTVERLADFFAPRLMAADRDWAQPGFIMRPRTVAVWRLPPDSRRFRTALAPAAGRLDTGGAVVVIAFDDREVFRQQIDAGVFTSEQAVDKNNACDFGIPIDLDISGARRLTVTVDFCAPGMINAAVRLTQPIIEK